MSLASDPPAAPFTVQEFSDLVSSAFNLRDADLSSPSPLLSLTPPSPLQPLPLYDTDREGSSSGCFEDETDDDPDDPLSPSWEDGSPQTSSAGRRSRSRTITALRVFHQVRTRASAFVLGPRAPSVSRPSSPLPFQPIPPLSRISPTLVPSPSPLSMVDLNLDRPPSRPRSRAESLPRTLLFKRETTPPPPLPTRQTRPNTSAGTRTASPGLRSFFDDSPVKSKRAYSRPSTSASTVHPLSRMDSALAVRSTEFLPSFFEDKGYQVPKPPAPHYSRPSTPISGETARIHTRLPPLRKAKSGGQGLFSRGNRKGSSKPSGEFVRTGPVYEHWGSQRDVNTPSPFTCPREVPPLPKGASSVGRDDFNDMDDPLPPSYVFERRGSATSNSTMRRNDAMASTRSSSSLSSKISSIVGIAFPSKMRMQARSKLNLSIATGPDPASAHSSPSTMSSLSSPTTPVSPTATFPRSQPYVFPGSIDGHSQEPSFAETEEDALAIGRVLTPEADPFAKAEIAVPIEGTPRPPTPPVSRRASSQTSPPVCLQRTTTWDGDREQAPAPMKRLRNSLPASPVSSAFTFPSSCSVYRGRESSPFVNSPPTPKRNGPPSAWSPFSTPAASSTSPDGHPSPSSSPARSISSGSKSSRQCTPQSPPSPAMSAFPLPPRTIPPPYLPPALPPPDRALPSPPLPSSPAPPVPPKDSAVSRVARLHKSLPPSPRPLPPPAGSPTSVRSYKGDAQRADHANGPQLSVLPLGRGIREIFPEARLSTDDGAPFKETWDPSVSTLDAPWADLGSSGELRVAPEPPATPDWEIRPVSRRRSVDSTSTVTASPSSSALHDAARGWVLEADAPHVVDPRPPVLQIDTDTSSDVLPGNSTSEESSDCCGSAVSLATFYSALSSPRPESPEQAFTMRGRRF
ncbi:hypothetical protein C8Q79DRAFT_1017201 [Trametes meyenii]|nr:hypothetical protein C8Q79DRAFT_1017201 [Trametes meyenii]